MPVFGVDEARVNMCAQDLHGSILQVLLLASTYYDKPR